MEAVKGCLLITNNVVATHENEFNAWYQGEHLDDRLGVAGFLSARRYVAVDAPQRYAAVYETRDPEVLLSPTYAALLRAPSPRTSAIMPHFRDMTRIIGRVASRSVQGAGGVAALLFIELPAATDEQARRIGAVAAAVPAGGVPPEAVRVVLVQPDSVGVDTPEARLRGAPDRRAEVVLMVEWAGAESADLQALRSALAADGWQAETQRGGLYRLLCARVAGATD